MNRFNSVIFAVVILFLYLAGLNDVFGTAQASKSAAGRNNGDLISKTTAAAPWQKYAIGFQADGSDSAAQETIASATASAKEEDTVIYEDELPGVLYDLKQTSDGEPTYLMEMQEGKQFNRMRTMLSVWNLPDTAGKESIMIPYLKRFVVSTWPHKPDPAGNLHYEEFRQFSRSPVNSYKSYFYQPIVSSENAPKTYSGDNRFSGAGCPFRMAEAAGKRNEEKEQKT